RTLTTPACEQALKTTKPLPSTFTARKRSSMISSSGSQLLPSSARRCWPGNPVSNGVTRGISPLTEAVPLRRSCGSLVFTTRAIRGQRVDARNIFDHQHGAVRPLHGPAAEHIGMGVVGYGCAVIPVPNELEGAQHGASMVPVALSAGLMLIF